MSTSFSQLRQSAMIHDESQGQVMSLTIPDGWMQGRTTYGGLTAALCLEAALRAHPDLPPLRSATISFIGPAGGDVDVTSRILRQGKSVTFVDTELHGEKGLATKCVFAFGAARASQFDVTFTPPPDMPQPDDCEPFMPEGTGPSFTQQFDGCLAKGGRPLSGSKEHDHFIWVRHKDMASEDVVSLLALADMPPPAVLPMFKEYAPISSMTWMVNILTDKLRTRDGWWLLQSRAENAVEGYSSQDMLIWNSEGDLVVAGRQSVAIFA